MNAGAVARFALIAVPNTLRDQTVESLLTCGSPAPDSRLRRCRCYGPPPATPCSKSRICTWSGRRAGCCSARACGRATRGARGSWDSSTAAASGCCRSASAETSAEYWNGTDFMVMYGLDGGWLEAARYWPHFKQGALLTRSLFHVISFLWWCCLQITII